VCSESENASKKEATPDKDTCHRKWNSKMCRNKCKLEQKLDIGCFGARSGWTELAAGQAGAAGLTAETHNDPKHLPYVQSFLNFDSKLVPTYFKRTMMPWKGTRPSMRSKP
jgi:hypothetical protein